MEALIRKIESEGRALNDQVLLVDGFLNHQVDPRLMDEIGREFARRCGRYAPTRVATIESSGIAPAQMTALYMDLPLVIMKKSPSRILKEGTLSTEVFSFTKNAAYQLTVKRDFIRPGDRVLVIDDFLAAGEAAMGASRLIEMAGARVACVGIVIEKSFQAGRGLLDGAGLPVESLARVMRMAPGRIEFLR
ncbi:MAG: xanthine phosphoribosyltransferase [Clostridiales bacterium]|nr:xanthine phosphoribosyltransferase [Clostridiales bacterium]